MRPSHNSTDVYFKTADLYGMSEIHRRVQLYNTTARRLPSLRVSFLHPNYTAGFEYDAAWTSWLEQTCSIRRVPRLETSDSPGQPSDILRHIVRCIPEHLIGVFIMHWDTYEKELANASQATLSYIRAAVVPTECGKMPLEKTFLGRPDMTEIWSDARLKDKFPFLSIPSMLPKDNRTNWEFLSLFGVTTTLTAEYLLESLSRLCQVSPREHAKGGFFKLYTVLADDPFPDFWNHASTRDLVYIPKLDGPDELVKIADCVWDGPEWYRKYDLAKFEDYSRNPKVKELFKKVLSKQAPGWQAALSELSRIKNIGVRNSNPPVDIYKYLATSSLTQRDWEVIRLRFTVNEYIYLPDEDTWCAPTECVWSGCVFENWQYSIRHIYSDLKEFFVHGLGVDTPDVNDCAYEIALVTLTDKPPRQISALIQELNGLSPTAKELEPLRLVRFLPVRQGGTDITYVSVDEPFLIADDERFTIDPKVPVLEMTTEEVCRLRTFIAAMNLESRYLSRHVIERTCPVDDAEESADLTHALRVKTKFLHRCTVHYGSTKEKTKQLFSGATVYTATGFRRSFSLEGGLAPEVSHEGRVHIEEAHGTLRIYVPIDPKQRAISYATELPRALVRLLKISDKGACEAFATVFRESVDILDDILTEKGIVQLPTAEPKGQALAIRTKNQVLSKIQRACSTSTSSCVKSTWDTTPIKLNVSKGYLAELNSSLSQPDSLADTDVEDLDITSPLFGYLFSKENRDLTAIDAAMELAAQSFEPGWMSLLLGRADIDNRVIIPPSAVEIAVRNEVRGHDVTKRLFEYMRLSGQVFVITERLLEAAAGNEGCGGQIMPILLEHAREEEPNATVITEDVLKAAVENTESGDALVSLLLGQQNASAAITEDVVIAAVENEDHGHNIIEQLLKCDSHIPVSPAVLAAGAGNMQQGLRITKLLLAHCQDNTLITEDVIISAIHNDIDGLGVLNHLKQHRGGFLNVTENILIAATESNYFDKIDDLFDLPEGFPVTTAVLEAAARSRKCDEEDLGYLLACSDADYQVAKATMLRATHNSEKVEYLVDNQSRLTEAILIAAAADVDWPLQRAMLDLVHAHDLRITEAVLVAASGNPGHGVTVVPLLLGCDKEIWISENVILAAVTNPGSYADEILQVLWDRQPDVRITEETIIAAASTDTSTIVRLIELINSSPKSAVQIEERLLESLSKNRTSGAKALQLLLDDQSTNKSPIPVTIQSLINAAGNSGCGCEVMSLLLDHGKRPVETQMPEEVLIAAAGNPLWGLEILTLLVDRGYTLRYSREVLNAAEENLWDGGEILAFLIRNMLPNDCVPGSCYPSEDEGSTFSGDTEVPEDADFADDKGSSGSADGSEDYETADDE